MEHALARPPTLEEAISTALAAGDEQRAAVLLRRAFGGGGGEAGGGSAADDDLPGLLEELAEYYALRGRHEDAIAAVGRAVLLPSAPADALRRRCRMAGILLRAGLEEEALALYAAVAVDAPGETLVHEAAGSDYLDRDDHELAYAWLTAGLELALDEGGSEECVARLLALRQLSMAALGMPPDDLDEDATARVGQAPRAGHDHDDMELVVQLDAADLPSERALALLQQLRRLAGRP